MTLQSAHKGYEYQDLMSSYFILNEVIRETKSIIKIDTKESTNDKFDDLTIINSSGKYKKQFKYSDELTNHSLIKDDLSSNSRDLALDELFKSWQESNQDDLKELRICLAWNKPSDLWNDILEPINDKEVSISNYDSILYQINLEKLWPQQGEVNGSWKRLKSASQSIQRSEFLKFCEILIIEVELPKFAMDVAKPGKLEEIVFKQLSFLGVGDFPNEHLRVEEAVLKIVDKVKRHRSQGGVLYTENILKFLNIKTDYGAIEQVFPVNEKYNVFNREEIGQVLSQVYDKKKSILSAEPGAGKSWFVNNLELIAREKGYKVIRHYCYTDLQDQRSNDRIKLNTFYGNLIKELLDEIPSLASLKKKKYSSTFSELNGLLSGIPHKTIIIIDGLDHISRIHEINGSDLSSFDIDIISKLDKLDFSDQVGLLVSSQPIRELDSLHGFDKVKLPNWKVNNIIELMNLYGLENTFFSETKSLASLVFKKSEGNPLYSTFLIRELLEIKDRTPNSIDHLPSYSSNLSEYYKYLMVKIPKPSLPYALCGCSFRVTNNELKEITGMGNLVDEQLQILNPILKADFSQGGYIIYHESFRRFIVDQLRNQEVQIKRIIFNPLIDWLIGKDFFSFPKAYRFLFSLLIEVGDFKKIENFINDEFVIDSFYFGNSEEAVKKNYHFMTIAVTRLQSFSKVVTLNEINRTIKSTENEFWEEYNNYIEGLGAVHGFEYVEKALIFEGKPTVEDYQGIQACYISSINGYTPSWNHYIDYLKNGEENKFNNLKIYLRYLFDIENFDEIEDLGNQIFELNLRNYAQIYLSELSSYSPKYFEENKALSRIQKMLELKPSGDIIAIAKSLKHINHPNDKEVEALSSLLTSISWAIKNNQGEKIDELISIFDGDFWFHNWILFHIKLLRIEKEDKLEEIVDCFELLRNNMEPFKGKPRACDLFRLHSIIRSSLTSGLKLITDKETWIKILKILLEVSNRTTTSLQGSYSGPLDTSSLFDIIGSNCPNEFMSSTIDELTELLSEVEGYLFHAVLAQYHFVLSKLNASIHKEEQAKEHLRKGITFLFGYTHRKDTTLEELLNSVKSFSVNYSGSLLDEFIELKEMVESVNNHTDGKGTRHFSNDWFREFNRTLPHESLLYLSNNLYEVEYSWVLENNLKYLLINLNGRYPDLEFMISSTLVTSNNEDFLQYRLGLFDKVSSYLQDFARTELVHIHEVMISKNDNKFSAQLYQQYDCLSQKLGLNIEFTHHVTKEKNTSTETVNYLKLTDDQFSYRTELNELSDEQILSYIEEYGIKEKEILSFYYFFESKVEVSEKGTDLVKAILRKRDLSKWQKHLATDKIFSEKSCYYPIYWMERFVTDSVGWFENHVNSEAFTKAYDVNRKLTIDYLFESMYEKLNGEYPERLLAGNLINTLSINDSLAEIVNNMWFSLKSAIGLRLPFLVREDWDNNLNNELNLSEEELLVKILLARFFNGSVERVTRTSLSLSLLLNKMPKILIKPLCFFFSRYEQFPMSTIQIVLQLIFEFNDQLAQDPNLKKKLCAMYPLNHFSIDFLLINLSRELSLPELITKEVQNTESLTNEHLNALISFNYKYRALKGLGYDLKSSILKQSTKLEENKVDDMEIFYNRSEELMVPNIYPFDYMRSSINTELYAETVCFPRIPVSQLYTILSIDLDFIISSYYSIVYRPDYLLPKDSQSGFREIDLEIENGWVTVGTFERSSERIGFREGRKLFRTIRGLSFGAPSNNYPYSGYEVHPHHVYGNLGIEHDTPEVIFSFIQEFETLEQFDFIWLNPTLLEELSIFPPAPYGRLVGVNSLGEEILRFEQWKSNFQIFYGGSIGEEVTLHKGGRIKLRLDYFEKLKDLFNETPRYYELTIHPVE